MKKRHNQLISKCNICGGKVKYVYNSTIYGKPYGSGKAYLCTNCGAFVGTNKNNPEIALGILADDEMRNLRKECHSMFDKMWSNSNERLSAYRWLAYKLDIPLKCCHFAMFDKDMLKNALEVLKNEPEQSFVGGDSGRNKEDQK